MRAADTSNLALKLIKAADLNITIWRLAYLKTENKTQYIADMQVKCILRNFEAIFHLLLAICLFSSLVCNFNGSTKKREHQNHYSAFDFRHISDSHLFTFSIFSSGAPLQKTNGIT